MVLGVTGVHGDHVCDGFGSLASSRGRGIVTRERFRGDTSQRGTTRPAASRLAADGIRGPLSLARIPFLN